MNNIYIAVTIIMILLVIIAMLVVELIKMKENPLHPPCQHKWSEIKTTDHYDISFGDRSYEYTTVRCKCSHCGEFKTFKLKG